MVQEVTIPLGGLNDVLPTNRFEDVTFTVPQVSDIEDIVTENVPTRTEIADEVADELEDVLGGTDGPLGPVIQFFRELADQADAGEPLIEVLGQTIAVEVAEALSGEDLDFEDVVQRAIEQATGDLDIGLPAEIEVGIDGSLFSVNEDFIDLLAEALDQVDFVDTADFPDLPAVEEEIDRVLTVVDEDVVGPLEELQEEFTEDLEGLQEDLELFTEIDSLEDLIDQIAERVARLFVSEEAEERLRESLED